jgi:tRNA(Ile)-lysidine synthase
VKETAGRVAVAVSGGRDSTALLHATLRAALPLGLQVWALHVNHGLQPEADVWQQQVRQQARRWGANFLFRRLQGGPEAGDSVEAWARRERYRALAEMAAEVQCPLVLLAHHRRDQAETFLLQALRGGGPAGLAAMPVLAQRHQLTWARPWLQHPREAVQAYVQRHRLRHVEDASNADARYARNRLRLQVWPALNAAFDDTETTLVQAARHAAHAAALADEVAAIDLPPLREDGALLLAAWAALPPARRRNALQAWLAGVLPGRLPNSLLQRLLDELPGKSGGRWPAPGAVLRAYRGRLRCEPEPVAAAPAQPLQALDLSRPGFVALPGWGGRFEVLDSTHDGVPPALLQAVRAAARTGGERFHLAARGLARSLKKQYQAAGVPAWARQGPLLWLADGRLLYAPGLGVDATLLAAHGQPQRALRWCPDAPGLSQPGR